MKYNSHVRTVNLSSSCALRWALSPAADSSFVTQLVQNSFTLFDVLCTRLQLFLLHSLDQTAGALPVAVHVSELTLHMTLVGDKFLELDGSRVHVINTVDDIACAFCVKQTLNDGSKDLLFLLSIQRQLSLNCLLAQLLIRIRIAEVRNFNSKLSMSTDAPQLFLLQSRTRSDFLHDQLFSAPSEPSALGVTPQRTCRQPCLELHLCNLHDLLDRLHRWY